jgi:ribosomal protein L32
MNRALYPVAPEAVVKFLYDRHAWHDNVKCVSCTPVRLSDLMRGLNVAPEQKRAFQRQLHQMSVDTWCGRYLLSGGVCHAYYPTGWQLTERGAMLWRKREEGK